MIRKSDTPIAPGKDVEIVGTAMSGSMGVVEEFLEQKERWRVRFASGVTKNFKVESLCVVKLKKAKVPKECIEKDLLQAEEHEKSEQKESGETDGGVDKPLKKEASADTIDEAAAKSAKDVSLGPSESLQPISNRMASSLSDTIERLGLGREWTLVDSGANSSNEQEKQTISKEVAGPEAVPETAPAPEGVNLAGRDFADIRALRGHMKGLQEKLEAAGDDVGKLEGQDCFLFFHLAIQHDDTREKLRAPISYIRYGKHHAFPNKCFIFVFSDGSEEPWSATKCIKDLFAAGKPPKKRLREPDEGQLEHRQPKKRSQRQMQQEQPRTETGLKLIGEVLAEQKHVQAGRWEYLLKDEARRCFAGFFPSPFPPEQLLGFYEKVRDGTTWDSPLDPRSGDPIPRKTAWMVKSGCTCTYRYGGVDVSPQKYPAWMSEIMEAYMPLCGLTDQEQWPDSCNLNWYLDGSMSVGWHSDNESLFQGRFEDIRILSVSLGHERTFELRSDEFGAESGSREKYTMRLSNGDLCTMEGLTQKYYQHRVPKERATGPRINLTWRWVKQHMADCPAIAGATGGQA